MWAYSRKIGSLSIVDIFCVALLAIYVPNFIFNPSATLSWAVLTFSSDATISAEVGIILMFISGSVVLFIYGASARKSGQSTVLQNNVAHSILPKMGMTASLLLFLGFAVLPGFIAYKTDGVTFLFGGLDNEAYSQIRRVIYDGNFSVEMLNRIRFSLLPIVFLFICVRIVRFGNFISSSVLLLIFFVALPMSLSKLPFVYYLGYVLIFYLHYNGNFRNFSLIKIFSYVSGALISVILFMSILYMLQYKDVSGFDSIFDRPINLAVERVWGENYSIVLRYFSVYPNSLPFSGFSSISSFASLFGMDYRNPDTEVPEYFFGKGVLTTNPGVFILSGYAGFGYLGVVVYSIFAFSIVLFLDGFHRRIKNRELYSVYFAAIGVNCTFLAQIALPTALLSYGLCVIPFILYFVDRVLLGGAADRSTFTSEPNAP